MLSSSGAMRSKSGWSGTSAASAGECPSASTSPAIFSMSRSRASASASSASASSSAVASLNSGVASSSAPSATANASCWSASSSSETLFRCDPFFFSPVFGFAATAFVALAGTPAFLFFLIAMTTPDYNSSICRKVKKGV